MIPLSLFIPSVRAPALHVTLTDRWLILQQRHFTLLVREQAQVLRWRGVAVADAFWRTG